MRVRTKLAVADLLLLAAGIGLFVWALRSLPHWGAAVAFGLGAILLERIVRGQWTLLARLERLAADAETLAAGRPVRLEAEGEVELARIGGALQRVSDRISAQETRAGAERDRLTAILEAMAEGVLVIDSRQRVLLANPAVRNILSLPSTPEGNAPELLEIQRLPSLHALAARALQGERQSEELALKDGRPILVHTAPIEGTGAVLVFHDLSDLRRLETVRRDFVANVSHELRTPLAAIRGYAETLLGGGLADGARAAEFVEVIHRHAERLSRLLDDLLELSRLEGGRRVLAREPVEVAAAAQRALELLRPKAEGRSIAAESLIPSGTTVSADRDAVEQILVNLLDNAVKYTGEKGRVAVRATAAPGAVRIAVVDDGPGIEPRHLGRIFERFYRVDTGRSREQGGTGLGLAIVKHLAQAMGGTVGVESEVGRGSTFWFELPDAAAPERAPNRVDHVT